MQVKHIFNIGTFVLIALTAVLVRFGSGNPAVGSLAVLTGCLTYHLAAWILSAIVVVGIMRNRADDSCFWFREWPWEARFYRFLKIREWKRLLPTYAPQFYDFATVPQDELLGVISQTEVVHCVAAVMVMLSLAGIRWFGHAGIIATIAALDFLVNVVYIFLQRYNRMRLRKLIDRSSVIHS